MKNILVATDLSQNSILALKKAIYLAKNHGANLFVVSNVDNGILAIENDFKNRIIERINNVLSQEKAADSIKVEIEVAIGNPLSAVLACADRFRADLIVIGMHEKIKLRHLFPTTFLASLIRSGNYPVLVVKSKDYKRDYSSILSATDFSISSKRAIGFAVEMNKAAQMNVLHVFDTPLSRSKTYNKNLQKKFEDLKKLTIHDVKKAGTDFNKLFPGILPQNYDDEQRLVEDYMENARNIAKKDMDSFLSGLKLPENSGIYLSFGDVLPTILETTKSCDANLIAMGTHGRSGLARAVIGSTTSDLLVDAPCDILVVKA